MRNTTTERAPMAKKDAAFEECSTTAMASVTTESDAKTTGTAVNEPGVEPVT